MGMSERKWPRGCGNTPGPGPQKGRLTVDKRSLAHSVRADEELESSEERRSCFYCLEGWVFLGSLDHDGEEVVEAIRCKRCNGTGRIAAEGL